MPALHQRLGAGEIRRRGDFQVAVFARDDRNLDPRGARHLDIVGRAAGMGAMRGQDRLEDRKPCGVCARKRPVRSRVPVTMPSAPRHSASVTASAGAAARAWSQRSQGHRSMIAALTSGRATSWISTRVDASALQRLQPGAHRGVAGVAARPRPARRETHRPWRSRPGAAPARCGRPAGTALKRRRAVQSSTRRPASGCHCLATSPPARVPRPAATMMAAVVMRSLGLSGLFTRCNRG